MDKNLWLVIAWEDWDLASKDSFLMVAENKKEIGQRIIDSGYYDNFNATKIKEVDGHYIDLRCYSDK